MFTKFENHAFYGVIYTLLCGVKNVFLIVYILLGDVPALGFFSF